MSRFAVSAIVFLALGIGAAHAEPRPQDILAQSKAAMGGAAWDNVRVVRTRGRVETSGLAGPIEAIEDARTGMFVNRYDLGAMKGADGFDGKAPWAQDNSGQVAIQGGDAARQSATNNAYRAMRGYWYPERMSADVAYAGAKVDGGRNFDVVHITPKGGRPFDLWFDSKTHVIDRQVERGAMDLTTTLYSDYRTVDGKLVAFQSRSTNGEARYDTVLKVESVTFEASAPATAFAPPPPPARDFGFLGGQKSTTVPFKLINNHMYIEVKLNGRGPYELLFDTGGSNVITPTVARELGLKLEGAVQGRGAGEKSMDVSFTKIERMEIGGAVLDRQSFASIPLESFGDIEGKPITGIFGYEVFKRFVVRTDYERNQIVLIEPNGFAYQGPGKRVPFELKETIPIVAGDIDGIPGSFQLDTGSRSTLDLMTPFVAKNNLISRYNPKLQGVNGWGVGGPARSWIVRGRRFTFGGVSVEEPVVAFSQATAGAMAETYTAGNVGAGVLKKFNIVWDYPRHQIFFERNNHYNERDVFNRAGLWANLGGGGFVVIDVYAGSPAAEAGLKAGDQIMAIDGKAAQRELSLPDFRARMKEAVGTKLTLDVVRGGQKLQIVVTLRELV
jgi:hypothetical protein